MQISSNSGKIIALTGAIASGKSYVLSLFERLGFQTINADSLVKELYLKPEIVNQIAKLMPEAVKNQKVELEIVRKILSENPELIYKIQDLMLPYLKEKRKELFTKNKGKAIIYEIPLLFETNQHNEFDLVIALVCPESVRRKRAIDKGFQPEMFDFLNGQQTTDEVRKAGADIIVDTSKTKAAIEQQIKGLT